MDKEIVRISVRGLVEFILRSGDLSERSGSMDKEAMHKGSRLHRKIQKRQGSAYRAEVPLKKETEYEDVILSVEGRADGIFEENGIPWIDEIKGLVSGMDRLTEPVPVHLAQAKCYALIYGESTGADTIGIQMTYGDLATEEIRRFRETYALAELSGWYRDLMDRWHRWTAWKHRWVQERNASTFGLEFPFPYREGQRKMVSAVYHAIGAGRQIFIQAPTGVGKTMSTVFPAVRQIGEGHGDMIFYLTARTIARTVAEEAFEILRKNGLRFKTITLTAKEKLCPNETMECSPETCPYAKGHFDRVNEAVFELLQQEGPYTRDRLLECAEKHRVCPFETGLDLALWSDGVICDYNYVFDPDVYLKRFFGEESQGRAVFLIDEAHNLADRSREMYSAVLDRSDVLEARRITKGRYPALYKALGQVNRRMLELEHDTEDYSELANPGTLPLHLMTVQGEMDRLMEEIPRPPVTEDLLDFYFQVRTFLNTNDLVDDHYVVYTDMNQDRKVRLHLFCVDPAANLQERLSKGAAAVFFSGTLCPLSYYRSLLSMREDDYGLEIGSPFPAENRLLLMGGDVSTLYARRNYDEYRRIASYIARTVWQKQGNYMIFFPSYRMMEDVRNIYEEEFSADWVRVASQTPDMSERDREDFLSLFDQQDKTLAAFCIMGGIFSEGIDLTGEKLIGAVIVGAGIPQVGPEREILKNYYDRKGADGFFYAYRMPGMNKVLQAAGRVIRTRSDVGLILLLDDRFLKKEYARLFPGDWNMRSICSLANVEYKLKQFWTASETAFRNQKEQRDENDKAQAHFTESVDSDDSAVADPRMPGSGR